VCARRPSKVFWLPPYMAGQKVGLFLNSACCKWHTHATKKQSKGSAIQRSNSGLSEPVA